MQRVAISLTQLSHHHHHHHHPNQSLVHVIAPTKIHQQIQDNLLSFSLCSQRNVHTAQAITTSTVLPTIPTIPTKQSPLWQTHLLPSIPSRSCSTSTFSASISAANTNSTTSTSTSASASTTLAAPATSTSTPSTPSSTSSSSSSTTTTTPSTLPKTAATSTTTTVASKKVIDRSNIDVVIYHGGCYDGMGAAWAAWKLLGDKAKYVPAQHSKSPPAIAGRNVALLDICYPSHVMSHILAHCQSLIVIDHHASAVNDIQHIPQENKIFVMEKSGATLAWEYFHPNTPVPEFLKYIEDRDLWNWQMPNSEQFNAAFMIKPLSMEHYNEVYEGGESKVNQLITAGEHIVEFAEKTFYSIAARTKVLTYKPTGHQVAVVNSSIFKSEIGNLLMETCKADFALVWNYDHMSREFRCSLRSSDTSQVDVSKIAKQFNGGGHPRASAFAYKGPHIEDLFIIEAKKKSFNNNNNNNNSNNKNNSQ